MSETVQYPSTTTIIAGAINTGNVSVNLDTVKQWAYLTPSTSNAATIVAGTKRFANTYLNSQNGPFWAGTTLNYSTTGTTPSPPGSGQWAYQGGVLLQY
jgi:hypothetical protein